MSLLMAVVAGLPVAAQPPGGAGIFPKLEPPVVAQEFTAIAPGVSTPPDTNGAVGPNHLLLTTNGTVRIQNRAGGIISSVNLLSFWSGLGFTDVFDPRGYFDPHSGRFIVITCAQRRSAASAMLLAVSATDDPTGVWHRWALDADPANIDWVDYGNLGFTRGIITFTGNMFSIAGDAFNGSQIWRIDTASALDGGAITMETFRVLGAGGTLVPCATFDVGQITQYVARTGSANLFGTGRVQLFQLNGAVGSTTFGMLPNAALGTPWSTILPNAPQLGSAALIETNDDRVLSAVCRDGRVWCCHSVALPVGGPVRTAAQWWEVEPSDGRSRQQGVLQDAAAQRSFYFPSLVVNNQGLMMLSCSGSSPTEYVSAYYAWRNPDTALGALEGYQAYHAGVGPFNGPRWGDYSGTYVDPVDGSSVWVLQQYAEVSNRWGIHWGQLTIKQDSAVPASSPMVLIGLVIVVAAIGIGLRARYIIVSR